ncbi:MAG: sugar transferase, partial [Hyphomicrobiales bacterium]|nr:sugar transferase [Hyphomicrobiales bacterium]
MLTVSARALPFITVTIDAAMVVLANCAASIAYEGLAATKAPALDDQFGAGILVAAVFGALAHSQHLFGLPALFSPSRVLAKIVATLAISLLAFVSVLFVLKIGAGYSRGATIVFSIFAIGLVVGGRFGLGRVFRQAAERGSIRGRRVVTLGDAAEFAALDADDYRQFGIDEIHRVVLSSSSESTGLSDRDCLRVREAIEISRHVGVAEFALVMPWSRARELIDIGALLRTSPLPVRLYPDQAIRRLFRPRRRRGLDPYFSLAIQREPLSVAERVLKRALDLVVAGAAIVVSSPLLTLAAVAIWFDSPGPVIFRQRRRGFDGRTFTIFKFRTMTVTEDGPRIAQAVREDRRVTRIGRVLRRTSVDELPQLLNVLRGEMSLVGPRPHAIAHDEEYRKSIAD